MEEMGGARGKGGQGGAGKKDGQIEGVE